MCVRINASGCAGVALIRTRTRPGRTIAQFENKGSIAVEHGLVHLFAPGGDELLTRLPQKQYVIPETRTLYATRPFVLIILELLVDTATSFELLAQNARRRVDIADPVVKPLG